MIEFACRSCEHKIPAQDIISRRPPSCECGREEYPHSHRGSKGTVVPYRCAFCGCVLKFINFDENDLVDATSFERTK